MIGSKPIPYGRQWINDDDIREVISALQSDFLTQGPRIGEFETAFAKYIGAEFAVAVSNGTAALHLSVLALGLKRGQKVLTTPITFAASANCVRYCDGIVEFIDIDPKTYLLDINKLETVLKAAPANKYFGIIPVDFSGRAINMQAIRELADKYGLWIIEDACHAPGGYFLDSEGNKKLCGSGQYADLSIFSFHPVKHIACGEGGMITTNSRSLYEQLLMLRTHGITRQPEKFKNDKNWAVGNFDVVADQFPGWYMEMQALGYNYRLTDMQAALGISQLKRADDGLFRRKQIAEKYFNAFKERHWLKNQSGIVNGHAYHLYIIEVENRLGLYNHLKSKNIFPQVHYIPVHLMPYYEDLGFKRGDFVNAENYYGRCLSLPMYPGLTDDEQDYVIKMVVSFYSE